MLHNEENSLNSQNLPFFARYLEGQFCEDLSEEEMNEIQGGLSVVTLAYPSDRDIAVTLKYPSDNEDGFGGLTRKYPSDHEDSGFVTKKYPSDHEDGGFVTQKYPSDGDDDYFIATADVAPE